MARPVRTELWVKVALDTILRVVLLGILVAMVWGFLHALIVYPPVGRDLASAGVAGVMILILMVMFGAVIFKPYTKRDYWRRWNG